MRINCFLKRSFAKLRLNAITSRHIQAYVDERSAEVSPKGGEISPTTVLKELVLLSVIFNWAVRGGMMNKNPVKDVEKPKEPEHRERVATDAEIEKLLFVGGWDAKSVPQSLQQLTLATFLFACRTRMRAGEILKLEETWIDGRVIHLPKDATKTESRRDVALSNEAVKRQIKGRALAKDAGQGRLGPGG